MSVCNESRQGRFVVLDALRGIAGLCVPLLHLSEPFTVTRGTAPAVQ